MDENLMEILLEEATYTWDDLCCDFWYLNYPLVIHFKGGKWFLDYDYSYEVSEMTVMFLIEDYKEQGYQPRIEKRDDEYQAPYYTIDIYGKTILIPLNETDYEVGRNIWVDDAWFIITSIESTCGEKRLKGYGIERIK